MSFANTAADAVQQTQQAASKTFEQTVATLKEGVQNATAGFEKTQAQVKDGMAKAMKAAEDLAEFNQGTIDALMKAGQLWTTGMQDLSQNIAEAAKQTFDEGVSTARALASVKSIREAMEIQSGYARTAMERSLEQSNKLTDASVKLAEQVFAPLNARFSMAAQKFSTLN